MSAVALAGYASIFGEADAGGDIVQRGAFAEHLARAPALPLLWQHDAARPLGRIARLAEDARGLRVIAELADGSTTAREAEALLRAGALDGLSIGYRVRRARARPGGGRELIALDLVEISLVTFPMHVRARVHALSRGSATDSDTKRNSA